MSWIVFIERSASNEATPRLDVISYNSLSIPIPWRIPVPSRSFSPFHPISPSFHGRIWSWRGSRTSWGRRPSRSCHPSSLRFQVGTAMKATNPTFPLLHLTPYATKVKKIKWLLNLSKKSCGGSPDCIHLGRSCPGSTRRCLSSPPNQLPVYGWHSECDL